MVVEPRQMRPDEVRMSSPIRFLWLPSRGTVAPSSFLISHFTITSGNTLSSGPPMRISIGSLTCSYSYGGSFHRKCSP